MSLKNKKKRIKQKEPHEKKYDSEKEERIRKNRQETIRKVKEDLDRKLKDRLMIKEADLRKEAMIREKDYKNQRRSTNEKQVIQIRKDMKTVIEAGVKKVHAITILPEKVRFDESSTIMTIGEVKYKLKNNVHMVGWGREALMLGAAFERIIGNHLKKGWLVVPRKSIFGLWNYPMCFPKLDTRITYYEAGTDGFPDDKSVEATRKIAEYCKGLKKTDILVVIISGGTEELLCYPKGTIGTKDILNLLEKLKAAGATSKEINDVRKKLSVVRGGGLARLAYPAKVITLIMSDVPGDPIDEIAGGPTVNDSQQKTALFILNKYNLNDDLPNGVREILEEKPSIASDALVDENKKFKFVDCYVIASIVDAIEAMAIAAFQLGLVPIKLSPSVTATVREVSQEYAKMASLLILAVEGKITKLEMYEAMKNSNVLPLTGEKIHAIFPSKETWGLGLCLLMGGRPLVEINGNGKGGPNQELALYFSLEWHTIVKKFPILNQYVVWFLGGSTSGTDGNTKVAGAYGYDSLGPDVYKHFKELTDRFEEACKKARNLARLKPNSEETKKAFELADNLKNERAELSVILPDYVMKQNNTNLMFMNINDGDDLLELGTGTGYTYTNVRDLHVIRIVRFQCNCDGSCLERNE